MKFTEFLDLVKVIRMLYGREIAEKVFDANVRTFYNLDSIRIKYKKDLEQI